jgi:HD-like signal output (HDOD) protein
MEQYLHDDFHQALDFAARNKVPIHQAESCQLGYAHTDIAEWLTENWNLPSEIRHSLIFHHDPAVSVQCRDLVSLIHIADWLCYETGMVIDGNYQSPQLQDNSMHLLKLQPQDIDAIKDCLPEELEKTSIFFDLVREK